MSKRLLIILIVGATLVVAGLVWWFGLRVSVPSEKQMARILADVYIADALTQEYIPRELKDKRDERVYKTILDHYGLTKNEYDAAVDWYSQHPDKWSAIYERAVGILSAREGDLSVVAAKADSIDKALTKLTDSITTHYGKWPATLHFPLSKTDTLKKYISKKSDLVSEFARHFSVDSVVGGHLTLTQKYTITKHPFFSTEGLPAMMLCVLYADSTADSAFVEFEAKRKVSQRELSITIDLKDSVPAIGIDAILLRTDSIDKINATLNTISLKHVPYYPSDSAASQIAVPPLFAY